MRFLFVVSGANVPSTRFRILPFISHLEDAGHRCDVAYSFPEKYDYFPKIGWRLSQRLKRAVRQYHAFLAARRKYDCIVIEREVFDDDTSDLEEKFRQHTKRLVLDVDDGVFLKHPEKFDRIARIPDAAIAGNRFLAEYLQSRCPHVYQIPTCVSMAMYPQRPPSLQQAQCPTIGWIGTTGNVVFLQEAAAALRTLASTHDFRLLVVAPSDETLAEVNLSGVNVHYRPWQPATEVQQILEMDLGIMPLPKDQPWMKFKCGLKLIQYLAVGIPGVATPIGINHDILCNGTTGRPAENADQWLAALRELLDSPQLRIELGTNGRNLVQHQYSVEANWRMFEEVLTGG